MGLDEVAGGETGVALRKRRVEEILKGVETPPHPIPLPDACLPVGRGRGRGEGANVNSSNAFVSVKTCT